MTLYEIALINQSTVSIDLDKIESVVDVGQWVDVTMTSGKTYSVIKESFVGVLQTADVKWFQFKREGDTPVDDTPTGDTDDTV